MESFWHDIRHGLRALRRQRAFSIAAIATLGVGIGAATTIFSVIYGVLLNPFPYVVDKDRVVMPQIVDTTTTQGGIRSLMQLPMFLDYQERSTVYEEVIAGSFQDVLYTTESGAERLRGGLVSGNTFQFLGVPALLGRALTPEDSKPGATPVFVMSYRHWAARFNLDAGILGQSFNLDGVPTTLVGIMPRRFSKMNADIYRATTLDRADPAVNRRFFLYQGKLKAGVSLAQADAEIKTLAQGLARDHPQAFPANYSARVVNWIDWVVGPFRGTLYLLTSAVGLVLLIACGNVANMLLASGIARGKEFAVRAAIGAGRARLIRQLLTESLLLALAGAILGCGIAFGGMKVLLRFLPQNTIPGETVIELNGSVLAFSLGLAVLAPVLFGLAPALQSAGRDLVRPLRDSRKGGAGTGGARLRSALVVAEVALSLVLLSGAAQLMRSFVALQGMDLGFNSRQVLTARLAFAPGQYVTRESRQQFCQTLLPRLQALPGVVSASVASSVPPFFSSGRSEIDVPGQTHTERWEANTTLCSESFFTALGTRMLRGRPLTEVEVSNARRVAVVNQTFVARYLGTTDPLGLSFVLKDVPTGSGGGTEDAAFEIVGVIADVRNQGPDQPVSPEAFVPYTVTGAFRPGLLIRTAGEPRALIRSVEQEIWAVDRNVAITNTDSVDGLLQQFSYAEPQFGLIVLFAFASVGLALVVTGVFSLMAYTVSGQTHEIGIRMALGATARDVLVMVMRRGLRLIVIGIAVGLFLSMGTARLLASQFEAIAAFDPLAWLLVAVLLFAAGLAACWLPARRATRVQPVVALRAE